MEIVTQISMFSSLFKIYPTHNLNIQFVPFTLTEKKKEVTHINLKPTYVQIKKKKKKNDSAWTTHMGPVTKSLHKCKTHKHG